MTTVGPECMRFDALLPDSGDASRSADDQEFMDTHVASCARCAEIAQDLALIADRIGGLTDLMPERDLWHGIEERIQAPVVALDGQQRNANMHQPAARQAGGGHAATPKRLAAAAVALIAASSALTYSVVRMFDAGEQSGAVAGVATHTPPDSVLLSDSRLTSVVSISRAYDQQISLLQNLMSVRRTQLDSGTVAVIERNLRLIDSAITESVQALSRDPLSTMLAEQYQSALDAKVGLLRTALTLPASEN